MKRRRNRKTLLLIAQRTNLFSSWVGKGDHKFIQKEIIILK